MAEQQKEGHQMKEGWLDKVFAKENVTRWIAWTNKNKWRITWITLALTLLAAWQVSFLRINSSLTALLPQDTPSIQRVDSLRQKIGGMGDLIVMVESKDSMTSVHFAQVLLQKIHTLPWVDNAQMGRDDSLFSSHKLLFMSIEDVKEVHARFQEYLHAKTESANPFIVDFVGQGEAKFDISDIEAKYQGGNNLNRLYMSPDRRILLVVVHPKGVTSDIGFARKIYGELDSLVTDIRKSSLGLGIQISVGGTYKNRIDEYETILSDVGSSGLFGVGLILLQLLLYFRRPLQVLVLSISLGVSLCWTFAVARITVGNLNLITAFLAIVLFGLGIDFGIHLLTRYLGERRRGIEHIEALVIAFRQVGRSNITAAATTAVAFYFLTFSDFLGFRHFGWIAGNGIVFSYLAFMIVFPALLCIIERTFPLSFPVSNPVAKYKDSDTSISSLWAKRILVGGLVLTIASIYFLSSVRFENDFRNLRSRVTSTRLFNEKVLHVFAQARDPSAVLVDNREEAIRVHDTLSARFLQDTLSPLEDVKSVKNLVPEVQGEKLRIFQKIKNDVESRRNQIPINDITRIDSMLSLLPKDTLRLQDAPEVLRRNFTGLPGTQGQVLYLYQRHSLMDIREAERFARVVGQFSVAGKTYHAISEPIIYVDLVRVLRRDSLIAAIGIILALLGIVYFDLRNWRATLLALSPVGIGFLWMFGGMGVLGIKLNLFNMVVIPSILGLSVDAGVHIYHRFQEAGIHNFRRVLKETGGASLLSTTTTMGGFGSLLVASHPGLRSLGELAILGMSTSLVIAILFLPAALLLLQRRKEM